MWTEGDKKIVLDWAGIDEYCAEYGAFLKQLYGDYREFADALVADVRLAAEQVKANSDQFHRRSYLRAFFAFVEGALFARRNIVSKLLEREPGGTAWGHLSDGERTLLDEIEYQLEDGGQVKVRLRNFQPFLKYLRFTFNVYFKYHDKVNPVDYSGVGWQAFKRVHEARNRITHPKTRTELDVSDAELTDLDTAYAWFLEQINKKS